MASDEPLSPWCLCRLPLGACYFLALPHLLAQCVAKFSFYRLHCFVVFPSITSSHGTANMHQKYAKDWRWDGSSKTVKLEWRYQKTLWTTLLIFVMQLTLFLPLHSLKELSFPFLSGGLCFIILSSISSATVKRLFHNTLEAILSPAGAWLEFKFTPK